MKHDVTKSSGNIFADIGLDNPEEELTKARFVVSVRRLIEENNLTQMEAGNRLGISQPDVSKLLRGNVRGFSLDRLLSFVTSLGTDVEIKFKKTTSPQGKVRFLEIA